MGRKKAKKVNPKKERYAKFRKEKPSNMNMATPDLDDDGVKNRRVDEGRINDFWRHYRRSPERYVRDRDSKSKR